MKSFGQGWLRGIARFVRVVCCFFLLSIPGGPSGTLLLAQNSSDSGDTIRGVVINSITREPIARALVNSPDERFATLTDSEGRFAFTLPKADSAGEDGSDANAAITSPMGVEIGGRMQRGPFNGPSMLMARKPGYRNDPSGQAQNLQNDTGREVTLMLTPESMIVGTVTLPTSEAPDNIMLQVFRREVEDGRAHWVPAGGTQSKSDGGFRFADLPPGTYKLLTHELLDNDPAVSDPRGDGTRGPLFGYPPVYYQNAADFGTAATIQLAAGQTQTVGLTLAKQPYYVVKVPVIFPVAVAGEAVENGVAITVYANGHNGPGFALGYNNGRHTIEGSLPNGTYTVEASSYGRTGLTGSQTITIKGGPIDGPSMVLVPKASIPVNVKEEFTSADNNSSRSWGVGGRSVMVKGPRRYSDVTLEPADDFGVGRYVSLPGPTGRPDDDGLVNALMIEGAPPGSYWVRVHSSRGYPASIRSGNLDLEHQPLVVGAGGAAAPIEITMRDDTAEISGTVEGMKAPTQDVSTAGATSFSSTWENSAHVLCIPLADSPGQFTEAWVSPDGSFTVPGLAPGAYRLLAFDRQQRQLEYRDAEAMRAYDAKGPVVRVAGGQKERVTLQLITPSNLASEQ